VIIIYKGKTGMQGAWGMAALFGTDGVRGLANIELTSELTLSVARAAARVLTREGVAPKILVGRDTRASGDMLEAAVVAGLCSGGANPILGGVMPTPALAHLVPALGCDGGVMITASHNPAEYNGLKLLDPAGDKLSRELELAIEELVGNNGHPSIAPTLGRYLREGEALREYQRHLLGDTGRSLQGLRIVLDCAHGAMGQVAPETLTEAGAEVVVINCSPNGHNINEGGAIAPKQMVAEVLAHHADAGLALDGDGDRVVLADSQGTLIDGDQMLAIWATALHQQGKLQADTVVGTVLTNSGLEAYLTKMGWRLVRTPVGDRYVAAELHRLGAVLGGETCGHLIHTAHLSSSDGLYTAMSLLRIAAKAGKSLSELTQVMEKRPQVSTNIRIPSKEDWVGKPSIREAIAQVEIEFGGRGRVVVRPSGTEPLLRITCEHEEESAAQAGVQCLCEAVAQCMEQEAGAGAHLAA
jgi:phosphoglucosamine mutase